MAKKMVDTKTDKNYGKESGRKWLILRQTKIIPKKVVDVTKTDK